MDGDFVKWRKVKLKKTRLSAVHHVNTCLRAPSSAQLDASNHNPPHVIVSAMWASPPTIRTLRLAEGYREHGTHIVGGSDAL